MLGRDSEGQLLCLLPPTHPPCPSLASVRQLIALLLVCFIVVGALLLQQNSKEVNHFVLLCG